MNLARLKQDFDDKGLRKAIRMRLGFTPKKLSIEVVKRVNSFGDDFQVKVSSIDISDHIGCMTQVLSKVTIDNFGGSIGKFDKDGNQVFGRKRGEWQAWVPVSFSWKHPSGGSNGQEWFTAFYHFAERQWKFRQFDPFTKQYELSKV